MSHRSGNRYHSYISSPEGPYAIDRGRGMHSCRRFLYAVAIILSVLAGCAANRLGQRTMNRGSRSRNCIIGRCSTIWRCSPTTRRHPLARDFREG